MRLGAEAIDILACSKPSSGTSEYNQCSTIYLSSTGQFDPMMVFSEEVQSIKAHWDTLKEPNERKAYIRQRMELKIAVILVSPHASPKIAFD